ncbi:dipicolinate synthase subunit DpsA [Microaerobacter geothermalis]|uniref:dipicolinate synthase subunit DpsA n=1 Tax=Microaerobacter geothermalis TaxID=674972 RepID=UPI001F2214DD|nr:dipicolinate synthase subunit DpsA [Microaerobacter geothermalis]MCF6093178.1 dipicolinate synthase subunit DpsA [Microaerobacter geothermalis]
MLTGIHVAFIGGDARQLEVIKKCSELDATITLIGFDNLESNFVGATKKTLVPESLQEVDAVILPIVGTDEKGHVESIFCSNTLKLTEEHLSSLPKHCILYTGMASNYLADLCTKKQLPVIKLLDRDDVAIYNSIPTTEGAIMMAIQNTEITIHGCRLAVLGFGRTGMTLSRILQAMGAHVKVGTRKPEHVARAFEMGFLPFHINNLADEVKDLDLLFNTVPSRIVTAQVIANLPHHSLIIDLASSPGGTDFRYAEKRGIKAILAPGLPGIVAPKTAGRIIANTITRLLVEQLGIREESK